MKQQKEAKISYFAAHLTTMVSVTLVLLMIGIIILVSLGAASESRRLREKIELSVIMADSVSNERAEAVCALISEQPYALGAKLITREEALEIWSRETGENLEETFGVNPLSPEVTFSVRAEYASPERLKAISAGIRQLPEVEDVATPDASMIADMNRNIERLTYILGGIALVMIVISFILINNTVHLSIHSRRFTIHTMQLVGATRGFIRRPFVGSSTLAGLIAGLIAAGILGALLFFAPQIGLSELQGVISWPLFGITAGVLIAIGMLICALASAIATTRYLRKSYGQLFR